MEKVNQTQESGKIPNGKISVSQFAYQKAQEKKRVLEKDITENVASSNKDYPESDSALIASSQLRELKKSMKSFYPVERNHSEKNVIQLGDVITFKHRKNEFVRIADGYTYATNVCPCLTNLVGKKRGDKATIGNMTDVEIVDFHPPK